VGAKVSTDLRNTPVQLIVIRKVDPANRKVVYASSPTVADLYEAATTWIAGERNLPPWLKLPIFRKDELKPRQIEPPHVSPLSMIALSKQIFLRNGKRPEGKKKEQAGLNASEAMRFFLDVDIKTTCLQCFGSNA